MGPGQPRAASTPRATCTRQPCCPTEWSWLQREVIAVSTLPRARNCTTRQAGPGRPRAASTPRVMGTARPRCPTEWSWLQVDLMAMVMLPRMRNCTTRRAGPGRSRAASTPRARHTASLLLNGMVLVAGGLDGITVSPSAELYETSTSTPTPTPTPTPTATPTPTPTPGEITLNAVGHRVRGVHTVDLSWTGATSANIDVYRDGAVVATTANDGFYTDSIGTKGRATYTYKVCEAGTQTCSNEVTVRFGGPQ